MRPFFIVTRHPDLLLGERPNIIANKYKAFCMVDSKWPFKINDSKGDDVEFLLFRPLSTIKTYMSNKISYLLLILMAGNSLFHSPNPDKPEQIAAKAPGK